MLEYDRIRLKQAARQAMKAQRPHPMLVTFVFSAIAGIGAAALATVPATEEFRADLSMLEQNAKNAGIGMGATMEAFRAFNAVSGETDSAIEAVSNLLQSGVTESNLQRAVENLAGAAEMFPDTLKIESLADSLQETVRTGQATGQFAELVERLGLSLDDVNYSLGAASDEYQRLNNMLDVLSSQGLAENHQAWVQQNQDLVNSRESQQRLTEALADLAETIQPIMTMVVNLAASMLEWFNGLDDGSKTAVVAVLGLLAAVGPVAGIISTVSGAFGALAIAQAAAGATAAVSVATFGKWVAVIALVVAAVAGLIAALNALLGKNEEVNASNFLDLDGTGSSRGSGFGGRSAYQPMADIPFLAQGALIRRNNPMLAVVGDNRREDEIIAPRSAIIEAVQAANAQSGGGGVQSINLTVNGDMAALFRLFRIGIQAEDKRIGTTLRST